jgi:formamidopyrimidine-DNA glycosylase
VPELPEVETVVRTVAPKLTGRRIVSAQFSSKHVVRENFAKLARRVAGRSINGVTRHGKFIVIALDRGNLLVHLGMTGRLIVDGETGPYTRAVFELDEGTLVYNDPRQFGRIEWSEGLPDRVARLGPDALTVTEAEFLERLKSRRRAQIKPLLLNQAFVRGLGNIYADEALFAAGIHPKADAARLSRARAKRLHEAMVNVLRVAIANKGSSISDYVYDEGRKGNHQMHLLAYGRTGEPCEKCGTPIRRVVLGGRGTHYCPKCQRA